MSQSKLDDFFSLDSRSKKNSDEDTDSRRIHDKHFLGHIDN